MIPQEIMAGFHRYSLQRDNRGKSTSRKGEDKRPYNIRSRSFFFFFWEKKKKKSGGNATDTKTHAPHTPRRPHHEEVTAGRRDEATKKLCSV